MAIIAAIVFGILLGMSYSRKGLFLAAIALVAVFLSVATALGFGAVVVHMVGKESPYAYSTTMFAIASFAFIIIRGALAFMDHDVDFHPLVERIGGAIVGLITGLIAVGFAWICLLCMPFPKELSGAEDSARQFGEVVLQPFEATARLLPGPRHLRLQSLLAAGGSRFSSFEPPPPPPPVPAKTSDPEQADQPEDSTDPAIDAGASDQD